MHHRSPWDVRIASVAAQVVRFTAAWVCVGPAFLLANLFRSHANFASFAQGLSDLAVYQNFLPHFSVQIFFHVYVCMGMLVAAILISPSPVFIGSQRHRQAMTLIADLVPEISRWDMPKT